MIFEYHHVGLVDKRSHSDRSARKSSSENGKLEEETQTIFYQKLGPVVEFIHTRLTAAIRHKQQKEDKNTNINDSKVDYTPTAKGSLLKRRNTSAVSASNVNESTIIPTQCDGLQCRNNSSTKSGGGTTVLIHCKAGMSRSPSIAIAYLIAHKNMTCEEALSHVKACRSIVKINPSFLEQLREWEINKSWLDAGKHQSSSSSSSFAKKYKGHKWIKVKREKPVEINGRLYISEDHHIKETSFLIDTIRRLAAKLDEFKAHDDI
mmetsp:Transcript_32006/g.44636  ORF Transcript_32006/g.44636 Transcript_32006/m.44636 type:complete len:263 (-) Transcript_32006:168-956(-)